MIRKIEAKAADPKLGLTPSELVGFLASLPFEHETDSGIEVRVIAGWNGQIKSITGRFAVPAPIPQRDQ